MIVGGHGRSGARNRGGGGRVDPLQPRDRPAGDGRQGGAPEEHLRLALAVEPDQARRAGCSARACRSSAGRCRWWRCCSRRWSSCSRRSRRPARADVPRRADARRARRAPRVPGDERDRARRDRRGPVRAPRNTTHTPQRWTIALVLVGLGARRPAALRCCARSAVARRRVTMLGAGCAFGWSGIATKLASDDLSQRATSLSAAAWGLSTGGGLGRRRAQRDERAAVAPGDPGGAGGVRDSDGRAGRASRRCCSASASRDTPLGGRAAGAARWCCSWAEPPRWRARRCCWR